METLLAGAQHRIQVITNHKNLIYFSTTRTLNRRQAQWLTFLENYDFEIIFRPGAQHMMTDVLARRSEFELTSRMKPMFSSPRVC